MNVLFPAAHLRGFALGLWLGLFAPFLSWGTTYYLSPTGNDSLAGLSPLTAWQTIDRVNLGPIQPGDSVLFEGNQTFTGSLYLAGIVSTPQQPLFLGAWGIGSAILEAGTDYGIFLYNCAGVEIHRLHILGDGRLLNEEKGIFLFGDQPGIQLNYFWLDSVEVSGFNRGGISFGDEGNLSGFSRITITHCKVFDNGDHGIEIERPFSATGTYYPHRNIYIAHTEAYRNEGQIGKNYHHTGNGIMVGNADSVVIEYCHAHHNGTDNTYSYGGPVGIWVWDCNRAIIQYNESHHNQTASAKDGGGFDLDGGTINSVLQYNYSHDNAGPGFMLAQFSGARPMYNNHVRYNISQNDAREGSYGALQLWRGTGTVLDSIYLYNNTIFVEGSPLGNPKTFYSQGTVMHHINLVNNIFISVGGPELVRKSHAVADIQFYGNTYYAIGGLFRIFDGGIFNSLAAWRNNTGQEELPSGIPVGYQGDPQLIAMGAGTTIGNPMQLINNLAPYQLAASSPLQDLGLDLNTLFSLDVGPVDFFQSLIPVNLDYDIGAAEGPGNPLGAFQGLWEVSRLDDGAVRLNWQLPLDWEYENLILERRTAEQDGFEQLRRISPGQESWLDIDAPRSCTYYRLAVDLKGGERVYLPLRQVKGLDSPIASWQVYPNPVGDELQVPIPLHWTGPVYWEIQGVEGQLIRTGRSESPAGQNETISGLEVLPAGIYWIQLTTEQQQVYGRFVKQ